MPESNFNPGPAQLGLGGNGKGDSDRSPGWRDKYDEVDWQREKVAGFKQVGPNRLRKVYRK